MRLTKEKLKQIIKEELEDVMTEELSPNDLNKMREYIQNAAKYIESYIQRGYSPARHRAEGFNTDKSPHWNVYTYMTSSKYDRYNLESNFDIYKRAVQKLKADLQKNHAKDSALAYTMDQIEKVLAA